jgi:chemotaxis signal transduction protein
MTTTVNDLTPSIAEQTSLVDRFILTQVDRQTLVFPATWVTEILRVDRSQILDLPFYDSLLVGIANYNSQMTPLIAAARLLELENFVVPERLMVVRLSEAAGQLENVGIVVDRAIGSSSRAELAPELFTASRAGAMVLMRSHLVPISLWQPQYWSVNN